MAQLYNKINQILAYICTISTVVISVVIIVDHSIGTHYLIKVRPLYEPTILITGFLFLLFGIGMLCYFHRARKTALAFFLIIPILQILAIAKYKFGTDFEAGHSLGQISPLSAISLICFPLAMIMQYLLLNRNHLVYLSTSLAGIPLSLAFLALLGYVTHFEGSIAIQKYAGLAPLAAILIITGALSVIFLIESQVEHIDLLFFGAPILLFIFLCALNLKVFFDILEIFLVNSVSEINKFGFDLYDRLVFLLTVLVLETLWVLATLLYLFQRRRVQTHELALNHQRLKAIVNSAKEAIITVDHKGRINFANEAVKQVIGYEPGDLLNQQVVDKISLNYANLEIANKNNETLELQDRFFNPDGVEVHVELCFRPISKNKTIKESVLILHDITPQINYEKQLNHIIQELQKSNEAKDEFLSNMSHELRTPMNGIIGVTDLLASSPLNDAQKKYIDILEKSGERLSEIIGGILDLTYLESGNYKLSFENFDLINLIEIEMEWLKNQAEKKGLSVHFDIHELPRQVVGDSKCVKKIIRQILSNSLKFTPKGHISLKGCIKESFNTSIRIRFSIKDTGIGISENQQKTLFSKFYQTDSSSTKKYQGIGHGLRLAKKLVSLMDGDIQVISSEGEGSTFHIELILEKSPAETI